MDLQKVLWIAPYKTGSKSSKLLADACGVLQIKRKNSGFVGKRGQFVLNWGAGNGIFNVNVGGATVLNPPELIDWSANKTSFFSKMAGPTGPRIPYWTTVQQVAKDWLAEGHTVIARTVLEGARGDGIVVMKKQLDFVIAPLYTIKVENLSEYRVYMFGDVVVDYRRKVGKFKDGMCVGTDIQFEIPDDDLPRDVGAQAVKAVGKLPLLMQGLDIIWDGKEAWVLETNTAPWLGTRIASRYARKLNEYISERQ